MKNQFPYHVAFDLGSGSLKMQAAWVDPLLLRIHKKAESLSTFIPLRDSIDKDPDHCICEEMIETLFSSILNFKQIASSHDRVAKYTGVGTESFRFAKNGKEVLALLEKQANVSLYCPSPIEEAFLGRKALIIEGELTNDIDFISWENGGGSMQITAHTENGLLSFNKSLGKIPIKNYLMRHLQKKDLRTNSTPNPILEIEALKTISWIQSELKDTPEWLLNKIPTSKTLGIGAMFPFVQDRLQKEEFTKDEIHSLLIQQIGKTDIELSASEDPTFMTLDVLFLYAVMDELKIPSVQFKKIMGSTAALLLQN